MCAVPCGIYVYINDTPRISGRERRTNEQTMKEDTKRMSLIIPPDLHRAFKAAAAADGKEMTELILEFIRDYVRRHAPAGLLKMSKQKRGRS